MKGLSLKEQKSFVRRPFFRTRKQRKADRTVEEQCDQPLFISSSPSGIRRPALPFRFRRPPDIWNPPYLRTPADPDSGRFSIWNSPGLPYRIQSRCPDRKNRCQKRDGWYRRRNLSQFPAAELNHKYVGNRPTRPGLLQNMLPSELLKPPDYPPS